MNHRHLLAPVLHGVVEGKADNPLAARTGVDAGGDGHGVRVLADGNEVFKGDIKALEVLAHEDDVNVFEAPPRDHGARRPQVGIEPEGLPQADVDGAEAAPDGRGQRTLQGELGSLDAVQGGLGERIASVLDAGHASKLLISGEWSAKGVEDLHDRLCNLRTNSIARN